MAVTAPIARLSGACARALTTNSISDAIYMTFFTTIRLSKALTVPE
jgi:hypothetical protein